MVLDAIGARYGQRPSALLDIPAGHPLAIGIDYTVMMLATSGEEERGSDGSVNLEDMTFPTSM